jgi:hypothetical protein
VRAYPLVVNGFRTNKQDPEGSQCHLLHALIQIFNCLCDLEKVRAYPLLVDGFRTNQQDPDGHILFFKVLLVKIYNSLCD